MTVYTVSFLAADLQAMANKAWEPIVDEILKSLEKYLIIEAQDGNFNFDFCITDLNKEGESILKRPDPNNDCPEELRPGDIEDLWLLIFERLQGSGRRIKLTSPNEIQREYQVSFYWGKTARQCGLSEIEFACLRVL